jgi:hypothetical protein
MAKPAKRKQADLFEVGAEVIYSFKPDPTKNAWKDAAAETRSSYRARMQELVNELTVAGFEIVPVADHKLLAKPTPREARVLAAHDPRSAAAREVWPRKGKI